VDGRWGGGVRRSGAGGAYPPVPHAVNCVTTRSRGGWTFRVKPGILRRVSWVFDVVTPLDFRVHCTTAQWDRIVRIKHPPMRDRLQDVVDTLITAYPADKIKQGAIVWTR